jgi:hypothetical protein
MYPQKRSSISPTISGLITALLVSLTFPVASTAFGSPQQDYEQCLRDGFSHQVCWDKRTSPNRERVASA